MTETAQSYGRKGQSPQVRRERRLARRNVQYFILLVVLLIGYGLYTAVVLNRPAAPVLVDTVTGELKGDYRKDIYRSYEDFTSAGVKFVEHFHSYNSKRVRRDQFIAMSMMSKELRQARQEYLETNDFVRRVEDLKAKSETQFNYKVLAQKGQSMRVEYKGTVTFTNLNKPSAAFHMIVDLKAAPVTDENSTGVVITAYRDF